MHFNFTTNLVGSTHSPQGVLRLNWRELLFGKAGRIMPYDAGAVSRRFELHLDAQRLQETELRGCRFSGKDF